MPENTNTGVTLTDVTFVGRQVVKYGAIALVALMVGRTLFTSFSAYWKATHPAPPPPPTVGFGKLPALVFPPATTKPSTYTLETASGTLPTFGDRAKVFLMPKSSPSLLADEQAKTTAAKLGFLFAPTILDSHTYQWVKSKPLETTLKLDINNQRFELATDYLNRPELLANPTLPDNFEAVERVKSMVGQVMQLPKDIATASGVVVYKKIVGSELVDAVSISDAEYLHVDLNRAPIDGKFNAYTPEGYVGIINAVVSGSLNGNESIVEIHNRYRPIDLTTTHTYPLRTTQSAWKLLQSGEGYVASMGSGNQAVVRDVYLGYYDSYEDQDYYQPVYVFEGDEGFLGYVPALDPTWVQTAIQ